MFKKNIAKIVIFSTLFTLVMNTCFCQTLPSAFSPLKTINPNGNNSGSQVAVDLTAGIENSKLIDVDENNAFNNFMNATDKFVQCNIKSSWEDFRTLITNAPDNDFIYMFFANKMADLGFFDLADLALSKTQDEDITGITTDAMKRFYYPRRKLRLDNELILAEAYSNILYNNQSSEAASELLKNEALISNSDYANYLVALGYYKSNNFKQAAKYINIATLQNSSNLNYQKLKAQVLAEIDEPLEALKIVDNLKKQNLYAHEYERKIASLEQFVLYKIQESEWAKNYHLGYYYYLENDSSKAVRTLQNAISAKRRNDHGAIYALMSEVYFSMAEFEKAADTAKKAYKTNKNNPKALITLGDLSYMDKDYKTALVYYKKAAGYDKKSYKPLVKEAQAYQNLANTKKAEEIYTKILKTYFNCWEAYYNVALLNKDKQIIYLKKAIAINPLFQDAWIELARADIEKGNYEVAQKYLSNAFYIDENNFKYYYYQGLINSNLGNFDQAKYNFKKCLKLNTNCREAKKALDSILNTEAGGLQDSI